MKVSTPSKKNLTGKRDLIKQNESELENNKIIVMLAGFSANILYFTRFFFFFFLFLSFDLVLSNHMTYANQLWS